MALLPFYIISITFTSCLILSILVTLLPFYIVSIAPTSSWAYEEAYWLRIASTPSKTASIIVSE
ncbi:hypothetical protein BDQ17DRAFT_1432902 [Cyathus striatus]|nr:hypothetical protein BDQ17DRAFT_1432902 [Cyathus striatus]